MIRITVRHKCPPDAAPPQPNHSHDTGSPAMIANRPTSTTSRVQINYKQPAKQPQVSAADGRLLQQQRALKLRQQQQQQLLNRGSVSSDAWSCAGSTPDLSRIDDDAVLGGAGADSSDDDGAVMMFEMSTTTAFADNKYTGADYDRGRANHAANLHRRSVSLIVNPEYDQQALANCSTGTNNGHHYRGPHYRNRHVRGGGSAGRPVVPLQPIDLHAQQRQPLTGTNVSIKTTTTTTTTTTAPERKRDEPVCLHVRDDSFDAVMRQSGALLREISNEFAK